jgi:hypothetical protein
VDDGGKAVEVLSKLLGDGSLQDEKPPAPLTEGDLELDFDFNGLSLTELAAEAGGAGEGDDDEQYRPQTIQECGLRLPALCSLF